jgi:hypothetical protein
VSYVGRESAQKYVSEDLSLGKRGFIIITSENVQKDRPFNKVQAIIEPLVLCSGKQSYDK